MPSEERGKWGAGKRAACQHAPGQPGSDCLLLRLSSPTHWGPGLPEDKVKGSPESTLPTIPLLFSITAMPGALEVNLGVRPAQDIEQSKSVIST